TFTAPSGYHRRVLEGCLLGPTEWERLSWDAELPAGSRLSLRLRSAASLLELQTAPWLGPFDSQPADLLLPPGPVPSLRFLEVELMLVSDDGATSPRVLDVSIRYNCPV
ncbi:MAG: hypothetical protein OEY14_02335, partial [Myxococcales bacterium]|nr:hypothetical protein [Myxococcales bacterium]